MYNMIDDTEPYATENVLERAYAFGVASVCGEPDESAYDRLKRNSPEVYDESIIELAYDEGRAQALELEAENSDPDAVWEELVETAFEWSHPGSDGETNSSLPGAITPPESGLKEGPPENLDLPSFLQRD